MKRDLDSSPIMTLAVSGPRSSRELFVLADRYVKNVIESSRGVGEVEIAGAADRAVQVNIDARSSGRTSPFDPASPRGARASKCGSARRPRR